MKIIILSVFTILSFPSNGQNKKNSYSINFGFHQTGSYQKLFYNLENDEPSYPTKQVSAAFFDFNVLYSRQTKNPKLKTVLGIGLNQKGFSEDGMASDGTANYYFYKSKLKKTYFSLYGGLSYDLLTYRKIKIVLGQMINPEIDLNNADIYKKIPLATRTNLNFTWKNENNFSLLLTPYFETALTKYNKSKISTSSSDYVPFGFGLNIGLAFGQ